MFPTVLKCLKDNDSYVQKNSASLVREIAKHTPELAQLVVNSGGVGALVAYAHETSGAVRLPVRYTTPT